MAAVIAIATIGVTAQIALAGPVRVGTHVMTTSASPASRASVAAGAVQRYYDPTTGLFCPAGGNCWWWSANELTAVIDYSLRTRTTTYLGDIANTYANARYLGPQGSSIGPFVDTWNDDDGWWGLAWVDAYTYARIYDPTHAASYLDLAEDIFSYVAAQWDTSSCGGGLWQNQKPTHTKDAIANELFLSLAASLYLRTGDQSYLDWASREWSWFQGTGLINAHNLIYDHLASPNSVTPPPCTPEGTQYWTYNQGVILGGLSQLYQATAVTDPTEAQVALSQARAIANCVTSRSCGGDTAIANPPLVDERGILTEACGTHPCTYAPSYQFKGVFVRNLAILGRITPGFEGFLAANAASLWSGDQSVGGEFGFYWDSPPAFYLPAGGEAPCQGSALDLFTTQL